MSCAQTLSMVHLGLSPVRVARFLAFCVCFVDRCLPFCPFPLVIVLFVLRFTDSDFPFGFFKLFFAKMGGCKILKHSPYLEH